MVGVDHQMAVSAKWWHMVAASSVWRACLDRSLPVGRPVDECIGDLAFVEDSKAPQTIPSKLPATTAFVPSASPFAGSPDRTLTFSGTEPESVYFYIDEWATTRPYREICFRRSPRSRRESDGLAIGGELVDANTGRKCAGAPGVCELRRHHEAIG